MPVDTQHEQSLIGYLEGLRREGLEAKRETDLADVELHQQWVRGQQWPRPTPRVDPQFVLNLLNDHVQRKTALLTDSRPALDVKATQPGLQANAEVLKACVQSLWDETSWQERLAKGIGYAMIAGCNVGMLQWDPLADHGLGDLRPVFFDPRAVVIDPLVTSPLDLDNAEYMVTEEVRALSSLVEQFGPEAERVRPDADVSTYPEPQSARRGLLSAASGLFRRTRRFNRPAMSQVPKAYCRHYWFKDWPRDEAGRPQQYERITLRDGTFRLRPRRRQIRHVVGAGGAVLVDEPNPYWHGRYPLEILDWGFETDHPWGNSEIRQLRSAQETLNRLASQMLRNAMLTNNFRVVGDINALDPDQWDALSNRPAIMIRKRPNTQLTFESPPALPAYLFTLLEFLVKGIEMVGGLNEAAKGTGQSGQSGITIEALQLAAQSVIRLQARRMEAFLIRLFTKALPMIFQFYTRDRVRTFYNNEGHLVTYQFQRSALRMGIANVETAFRDFVFSIRPGSSLNATRIQKAVLTSNLYTMGLIPGLEVLKAVEFEDPEGTLERAQAEQQQKAMAAAMAQAGAGGGASGIRQATAGGSRTLQSFPAGGQPTVTRNGS